MKIMNLILNKMSDIKNKFKKIGSLIIALVILFNITATPVALYAQEAVNTSTSFANDPTKLHSDGAGSFSATSVAGCAKGLLSSTVGGMFTSAMGKLSGNISGMFSGGGGEGGGIIGIVAEVPVKDQSVRDNTSAVTVKETGGTYTPSLDGIAHCIGNMLIEGLLQSTITWVKGGFQGNPAFIEDPARYFTDLADYELGQALNDLSGGVLCSMWDVDIRLGLLSRYRGDTTRRGRCTITDIIGNAQGFIDGNFDEGGWDAWFELTQNKYNNPYTSYLNAINMYEARVSSRNASITLELNWANGWRSEKDGNGETTTPGSVVQETVSKSLNIPAERLTFADEFDELVSELFNSLVTTIFEGF
jgi:hypothetical protein